jgi:hypothetical protein
VANAGSFWAEALLIASLECLNWALAIRRVRKLRESERKIIRHLALRLTEMGGYMHYIAAPGTQGVVRLAKEALANDMRRAAETPTQ